MESDLQLLQWMACSHLLLHRSANPVVAMRDPGTPQCTLIATDRLYIHEKLLLLHPSYSVFSLETPAGVSASTVPLKQTAEDRVLRVDLR